MQSQRAHVQGPCRGQGLDEKKEEGDLCETLAVVEVCRVRGNLNAGVCSGFTKQLSNRKLD